MSTRLTVDAGAYLEYVPDPIIPFAGARLSQETSLTVDPGGSLVHSEIWTPGRVASGESLAYADLQVRLVLLRPDGRILFREAWGVQPGIRSPGGIGLLGEPPRGTIGEFIAVSPAIDPPTFGPACRDALSSLEREGNVIVGLGELPGGGGVAARVLGFDTSSVQAALNVVWSRARQSMLGVELPPQRKM